MWCGSAVESVLAWDWLVGGWVDGGNCPLGEID